MLRLIGVQPNVRGWRYIVDGVKLVAADEELAHHMTKELYPAIAAKHDTTKTRVERCIRHAIEWGLHKRQSDMLHYLGTLQPMNAAFIAGVGVMVQGMTEAEAKRQQQRRAWDAEHLRSIGTKLTPVELARLDAYCFRIRTTRYSLLRTLVLEDRSV